MKRNVVTIGGGTGHYSLLKALRRVPDISITAVVSMADSGGSTGHLRDAWGALPPGDILQCLLALSDFGDLPRKMLRHRFVGGQMDGDNAGNWLLTGLHQTSGSFLEAIRYVGQMLSVRGRVFPITVGHITLHGRTRKGVKLDNEAAFDTLLHALDPDDRIDAVWLEPSALILGAAAEAIEAADCIFLAPGSLHSSILPVLLVNGVSEVIARASAPLVYVCNLMATRGQTEGFTVPDFVSVLERHLPRRLDAVVYNTADVDRTRAKRYATKDDAHLVEVGDVSRLGDRRLFFGSLVAKGKLIRHDEQELRRLLMDVLSAMVKKQK